MNGTCSGTHIVYQYAQALEAEALTPSCCLPLTALSSLISISPFLRERLPHRKTTSGPRSRLGARVMALRESRTLRVA